MCYNAHIKLKIGVIIMARMNRKKILMNEKRIIRIAIAGSGNTIKSAAEKAGIKNVSLSNQLGNADSTMTLTSVYALLNGLGYEIVVRKKVLKKATLSSY